ncbi:distant relative of cell wall-associated hydrolase [Acidovorax sp. NPDC077693]|uniref:distant relative of cell wall-associated hydrolase n=1 Tax=unclassified Acidovorax TaxID=2684926 RepID=UPI0037C5CCC9
MTTLPTRDSTNGATARPHPDRSAFAGCRLGAALAVVLVLGGCATRIDRDPDNGLPTLQVQNRLLLTPANGGQAIGGSDLRAGDIILSATHGISSLGIRMATLSPVSHAALYLGDDQVIEAVGSGIRIRSTADFIADEATIVAFRHPGMTNAHADALRSFAQAQDGKKYNTAGIVLQAPFTLQRAYCELPLVPGVVRDACLRGMAAIQLGAARNDRFFCSQLVLEAYRAARLPLTDASALMVSPADLLHMREGDVPSVQIKQALQYVGHLKGGERDTDVAAAGQPAP